jgi:hypothetical protein
MFSAIYNWFIRVEHDVEAIISDFTDTVTKLEAAAVAKGQEATHHVANMIHYQNLASAAENDAKRASAVAAKIKELVA